MMPKILGFRPLLPVVLISIQTFLCYMPAIAFQKNEPQLIEKIKKIRSEKLMKLTLNIFLASGDLKNAYLVAKTGYKKYPDKIFWLKILAKICMWTGKEKEAMDLYLRLYKKTGQNQYRKKAFDLAVALNKFDIAKQILKDQIDKGQFPSLNDLLYIYQQAGYPFELINILEKRYAETKDEKILKALVPILWTCGMIDEAINKIKEIEKIRELSIKEALLYSEMLYAKGEFRASLLILKRYMNKAKEKDVEFWKTLSDLAWTQREYDLAVKASRFLYKIKKARITDYERLYLYYYSKNKYIYALNYAIEGYRHYKKDYLFYGFLTIANALKKWSLVLKEINKLKPKKIAKFKKNIFFLTTYATALIRTGNSEAGKRLLEEALEKNFDPELLGYYIYTLLDLKDIKGIRIVIKKYAEQAKNCPQLAIPFATCYLYLQNGRKAMDFIQKAPLRNYKTLLLKADILSLFGKEQEAEKIRFLVWKKMKDKLLKKEKITYENEFLEDFLRLAIQFDSSYSFHKYMSKAEKKLNKSRLMSIKLSYLISIGEKQKARFLMRKMKYKPDPWISLSISISNNEKYLTHSILKKRGDKLSLRDKISAFQATGQIKNAMDAAFRGLERNWYNASFWKQLRNLVSEYGNKIELKSHYIERGGYREIKKEHYLKINPDFFKIGVINKTEIRLKQRSDTVINTPLFMNEFLISGEKGFDRYMWKFYLGIIDSLRTKPFFGVSIKRAFINNITLDIGLGINKRSDETLFLYIAGIKDQFYIQLTYPFFHHFIINLNTHYNRYHAQDDNYLGYNLGTYSELIYIFRWGYPDLGARLYLQHEDYTEKGTDKGVIDHISPYRGGAVLPDSFNQIGFGIFWGYENKERFVRSWRPFFKLDTTANDQTGMGFSLESGFSTPFIIGHDNISIGINYIRGFKGTEDNYYDIQIKWRTFF